MGRHKQPEENKISATDIINDLIRLAKEYDQNSLSVPLYVREGKYSFVTVIKKFGTWNNAITKAGLEPFKILTEEDLLDDIRRVAKLIYPNQVAASSYKKHGKYVRETMNYRFGSWSNALIKAGVHNNKKVAKPKGKISNEKLLNDLRRAAIKKKSTETVLTYYRKKGKHSVATYYLRFGSWKNALLMAGLLSK
jgi:hypothetical protein